MMSWMKSQSGSPGNMERKKVEPGATYSLFEDHWAQAVQVMQTSIDSEGALIVISHLSQMISFLVMTRGEPIGSQKSCKGFWLQHRCSDEVIRWLHDLQVKGMEMPEEDELKLVAMLHSLCEVASRDGELLGYIRSPTSAASSEVDSWDGAYALASLLLEYSLRNTVALAGTARYSFIQLIQLAGKFPGLERSLSQESGLGLTNVVVSGLSACFAQLPTFIKANSTQLGPFIDQLQFVNDVAHAAPETVANTIADCFSKNFLHAVIKPALTQDEDEGSLYKPIEHDLSYVTSLNEEIGIVTFYLEVVCRNVTHPELVKSLIEFVNQRLLNTLIHRLSTNESVSVVVSTLSLFNALLESYSEDLWVELILKYLTPQQHLMVSQRGQRLPDIDFYESSTQFLCLIPIVVCDVLGAECIEANFVQYVNQASMRWSHFDATVGSSLAITRSIENDGTHAHPLDESFPAKSFNVNFVFPNWKHNYDGTRSNSSKDVNEQETAETGVTARAANGIKPNNIPLPDSAKPLLPADETPVTPNFTTINLTNGSIENLSLTSASLQDSAEQHPNHYHTTQNGNPPVSLERQSFLANQSDGYASMESGEATSGYENDAPAAVASLGPFLDSLLVQLSNWPHLDLSVILVLTEVMSLLASCRIPLVTSLLLDSKLTLQPCYLTFYTLLKRIREDMDYQLREIPRELIARVWETMSAEEVGSKRLSASGGALALSSTFSNQLGDTIRKTIGGGGAEAIANVWKRFNRKSSSPGASKVQMYVNPSSGRISKVGEGIEARSEMKPVDSQEASKIMVTRMIFFSHWLLELGAIAQQLCWSPAYEFNC